MSLLAAHSVTDRIEAELMAAYPSAEILFHQDPRGVEALSGRSSGSGEPSQER
jgi:divalent metal cation (Fe/Co/Zn/Cd) transporter